MRKLIELFVVTLLLVATAASALETTNRITDLNFWAQPVRISLTGVTPGALRTNGIIASTRAVPVSFSSQDIVRALSGQLAFTIGRAFTNYSYTTTNFVTGPDIITTNYVEAAYPVYDQVVYPTFSAAARLMLLQPLGEAGFVAPMFVIRDGNPAADYVVNSYFELHTVSHTGEPGFSVVTGRFDILHDLVAVTDFSVKQLIFSSGENPPLFYFDVRGYATERKEGVTRNNVTIDRSVTKSLTANVAGTGQVSTNGAFSVLRGKLSLGGGKLETR